MRGYVYCLSNPAMLGFLKIGFTERPIVNRLKELSSANGVAMPFELEFCVRVRNANDLERRLHIELQEFRVSTQKEFFRLSTEEAVNRILSFLSPSELSATTPASPFSEKQIPTNDVAVKKEISPRISGERAPRSNSGSRLNDEWEIGARHVLYRKNGKFYMPLERFPGALCDEKGYILFKSEADYRAADPKYLRIGVRVSVPKGISNIPGYV
jgi:hypothetical protein